MSHQDETTGWSASPEPESASRTRWISRWPLILWALLSVGLVGWVATGSVSTTSYTYNQFLQLTFRNDRDTKIQEIWTYQFDHLPDAGPQWLIETAFDVSLVLILISMVAGCWLLLVRSTDHPSGRIRLLRGPQNSHRT